MSSRRIGHRGPRLAAVSHIVVNAEHRFPVERSLSAAPRLWQFSEAGHRVNLSATELDVLVARLGGPAVEPWA